MHPFKIRRQTDLRPVEHKSIFYVERLPPAALRIKFFILHAAFHLRRIRQRLATFDLVKFIETKKQPVTRRNWFLRRLILYHNNESALSVFLFNRLRRLVQKHTPESTL
jgi:hypothetical protein